MQIMNMANYLLLKLITFDIFIKNKYNNPDIIQTRK